MPSGKLALTAIAFAGCVSAVPHTKPGAALHHMLQRTVSSNATDRSAFFKRDKMARIVRRAGSVTSTQPSNIADGTATSAEGCTQWVQPSSGDSCYSVIALSEGLTLSDFYDLNTSLDQDCQNLSTQSSHCIDTTDSHDGSSSFVASSGSSGSCKAGSSSKKSSSKSSTSAASPTKNNKPAASIGISIGGSALRLSNVIDTHCGKNGAARTPSKYTGPNGDINFLNCGLSKTDPTSGWTPPTVLMSNVVYQDLDTSSSGPFAACQPYFSLFEKYGKANGIPPIFLASFAMQESSCNPNASGDNGGAYGLMQITEDKCGGAPGGNCNDPDYNVKSGAAYFKSVLDSNNGNVLLAIGAYNGWPDGLTFNQATAAANQGCCQCQNNLDYLHQFLNGWAQNAPSSLLSQMAVYNNLASCPTS